MIEHQVAFDLPFALSEETKIVSLNKQIHILHPGYPAYRLLITDDGKYFLAKVKIDKYDESENYGKSAI